MKRLEDDVHEAVASYGSSLYRNRFRSHDRHSWKRRFSGPQFHPGPAYASMLVLRSPQGPEIQIGGLYG
jgi:hypothetical protein